MANPRINIRINLTDRTKQNMIQSINTSHIPKLERSVIANVESEIIIIMSDILENDTVYQGLAGEHSSHRKDLMAQFGLIPDSVDDKLYQIKKIFTKSINIQRRKDKYGLVIIANREQIENELITSPIFQYVSYKLNGESTGYLIPWMKWIVTGEGSAEGFISFDATNVTSGRSERAIMIPTPGIHWTVSNNVDLGNGNFIDRILNDPSFKSRAARVIEKEYRRQING